MSKTELTFQQVEQLQHILKYYMYEFKKHTSKQHYNELEILEDKLTTIRIKAEYLDYKNNDFINLEKLKYKHKQCLEFKMYERAAHLRDEIRKKENNLKT